MKKIGIDCRIFGASGTGIARYTYHLISEILKIDNKNQYVLFMHKDNDSIEDFSKYTNVKFVYVDAIHYGWKEQILLPYVLYREKLDLMHFTHFNAPIFYFGNSIVTIHDLTLNFFPGQRKKSFVHKLAYRISVHFITKKAKHIISVSNNTKKDLINILKINPDKITVIYESVEKNKFYKVNDINVLNNVKYKYNLPDKFLLYVGVFRKHKNIDGLIKAFKILKTKYNQKDLYLVLVGQKKADYEFLYNLVKEENLLQDVIFTGFIDDSDLNIIFNLAKVFVFPSFYEGFGLPLLEAFSAQVPVAASNTTSLPEIGDNAAVYFNPYDINDIADKIYTILSDKDLYNKLIQHGLNRLDFFDWGKMATETLKLYNQYIR